MLNEYLHYAEKCIRIIDIDRFAGAKFCQVIVFMYFCGNEV